MKRICARCGEHPAKYRQGGRGGPGEMRRRKMRADNDHEFCNQCVISVRNQVVARELAAQAEAA